MIREELRSLLSWEQRHRRLLSRLAIAFILTLLVDVAGSVLTYMFEAGVEGGGIHTFGDAVFFSTVQLLTVSSQLPNPLTTAGRVVDVFLELWAIIVVAGVAGSFSAFFSASDSR